MHKNNFSWTLIFLIFLTTKIFALQEDRSKVANLSADNADLNQSTRIGRYQGSVAFDQGTTHLRAAKALTKMDENSKLSFAIAYGDKLNQVHYWEQVDINKPLLHAYADIIRYYPKKNLIELEGHARVTQGRDTFESPIIRYNTEKKQVIGQASKFYPVLIRFHPEKKS